MSNVKPLIALTLKGINPKHTVRDRGSAALETAYTAWNTVYTVYTIQTALHCLTVEACIPTYIVEKVKRYRNGLMSFWAKCGDFGGFFYRKFSISKGDSHIIPSRGASGKKLVEGLPVVMMKS